MKSKLLAPALGMALLATSALALADNGRGHDNSRGHADPHRNNVPYHSTPQPRPSHYYGHPRWHGLAWRRPGGHAPHHQHYRYGPRHYGHYDDGVTIIFKGRID